jgi:hypothetical protein
VPSNEVSRGGKRWTLVAAIASIAIGITWLVAWRLSIDPEPGRLVHAGPRTTVLTEPLLPDGSIDYVAWMTARLHEGVTAENDLAPIISLCLDHPMEGVPPAADFERPPAPVISWDSWCYDHPLESADTQSRVMDADTDFDPVDPVEAASKSWAACDSNGPHAAEMRTWLASIGPALDLIASQSKKRDRWFEPPHRLALTVGERSSSMRTVVPAFCARAIGRAMDGSVPAAVDDLECARRLVAITSPLDDIVTVMTRQLLEWRWQLVRQSIAEHFERFTCANFRRLEGIGEPFHLEGTVSAIRRVERIRLLGQSFLFIRDWRAATELSESMDRFLGSTMSALRDGKDLPAVSALKSSRSAAPPPKLRAIDMDRFLEALNAGCDVIDAALATTRDWRTRIAEVRGIGDHYRDASERRFTFFWDFWRTDRPFDEWVRRSPDRCAALVVCLDTPMTTKGLGTIISNTADADRARVRCAIACFKNEFGRPPAALDELVPTCFDAPPMDRICHKPMELTFGADGKLDVTSEALTLAAEIKADDEAYMHRK